MNSMNTMAANIYVKLIDVIMILSICVLTTSDICSVVNIKYLGKHGKVDMFHVHHEDFIRSLSFSASCVHEIHQKR